MLMVVISPDSLLLTLLLRASRGFLRDLPYGGVIYGTVVPQESDDVGSILEESLLLVVVIRAKTVNAVTASDGILHQRPLSPAAPILEDDVGFAARGVPASHLLEIVQNQRDVALFFDLHKLSLSLSALSFRYPPIS